MAPGPVPMPPYVGEVFASCNIHHRTKEFSEVLSRVFSQLPQVFQTEQHCYILPATGTGGMEAAVVSTLSPGDEVIVVDGGKFGERWAKVAYAMGLSVKRVEVEWGAAVEPSMVEDLMGPQTKAILVQACETSTGVAHPIEALGTLCRSTETLLMVDGITALAAYDLPMDAWGIDALVGGSQKGFMLPTGLSFVSLSEKAEKSMIASQFKKYYWDLKAEKAANLSGKTRYSTPVQFVLALGLVLDELLIYEGLDKHFAKISRRAQVFRDAVNLPLFCQSPSPSLTCLAVPGGSGAGEMKKRLFEDFAISIVAGQDRIQDKVLRIGHMGQMTEADQLDTAKAINALL